MLTKDQVKQIAREYSTKGSIGLANELRCSASNVEQIATRLRNAGIPIPRKNRAHPVKDAIAELKTEMNIR